MAMDTSSGIARGARKLKQLGDKIVIPDTQTLYQRKVDEIAATKSELARAVARIIEAEKLQPSQRGNFAALLASRRDLKTKIERLQTEAALIKQQIISERPAPAKSTWAQAWSDAAAHDPYGHIERGSPERIAEAQAELDAINDEFRRNQPSGNARDAWAVRKAAARTKLEALRGAPYPAHRPWASDETLRAARKAEGFKE
jgi:DNA polymerase III delta prime subunit